MQLLNLRLGLATNSSSTHSLVFLEKPPKDKDIRKYGNNQFGWQFFTASSKKAKQKYLAIMLHEELSSILPDNICQIIFNDYLPNAELPESEDNIDHQSKYVLPYEFGSNIVSEAFFKEFRDYILQDKLVILGGNDNEEESHPLSSGSFVLPIPQDDISSYVCRKDPIWNYWTFFRENDGTKIRFSLNDNDKIKVKKAYAPELVDVKISDFCPYNCDFCYMDSTTEGKHADDYFLKYTLLDALKEMKVFEVAFGGGEPTLHPDFDNIIRKYKEAGIVPNFTTRNLTWLLDEKRMNKIINNCGAFAYSLNISSEKYSSAFEVKQIKDLRTTMDYHGIERNKAVIHLVMGTIDQSKYCSIIRTCKIYEFPITLLGYKTTGRGKDVKPINYDWWLEATRALLDRHEVYKISIDTVMAKTYEQEMLDVGIPHWMFHVEEGTFSCFIDGVNKKFGKSSFCLEEEMTDLPINDNEVDVGEFLRIYQEW